MVVARPRAAASTSSLTILGSTRAGATERSPTPGSPPGSCVSCSRRSTRPRPIVSSSVGFSMPAATLGRSSRRSPPPGPCSTMSSRLPKRGHRSKVAAPSILTTPLRHSRTVFVLVAVPSVTRSLTSPANVCPGAALPRPGAQPRATEGAGARVKRGWSDCRESPHPAAGGLQGGTSVATMKTGAVAHKRLRRDLHAYRPSGPSDSRLSGADGAPSPRAGVSWWMPRPTNRPAMDAHRRNARGADRGSGPADVRAAGARGHP